MTDSPRHFHRFINNIRSNGSANAARIVAEYALSIAATSLDKVLNYKKAL
ncbi:hypothetical protein [Hellea balneolensis]|nr:hypothetical protein [Hellea balneolensis]